MTTDDDRHVQRVTYLRRFAFARMVVWLALTAVAWMTGWIDKVWLVSLLSFMALVLADYAGWRSDDNPDAERIARLEEKVDELLKAQALLVERLPKPRTRTNPPKPR